MCLVVSSFPAVFLLYPCCKVFTPLISICDAHGLPYHHRNDGLCLSHAAVNGSAACGMGKREHAYSPSAYKSADREQASSPVCLPGSPSSRTCYSPLIFRLAPTVLGQYIFLFYPYILIGASCQSMPLRLFCCKINVACLVVANRPWQKSSLSLHSKRISAVRFAEKTFRPIPEAEK